MKFRQSHTYQNFDKIVKTKADKSEARMRQNKITMYKKCFETNSSHH